MRRAHENAIDGARLNAQRAEHTFRVINRVAGDLETLARFDSLFTDINAIDGASLRALIACNTCGEVKAVEASIASGDRHR